MAQRPESEIRKVKDISIQERQSIIDFSEGAVLM
jgi:hypothetical protein